VGARDRCRSCGNIDLSVELEAAIKCDACGAPLKVCAKAVAKLRDGSGQTTTYECMDFGKYEIVHLRRARGIGTIDVVMLCSRCYNNLTDLIHQALKEFRDYVAQYGIVNVEGIDKAIEFSSVEEMRKFVAYHAEWISEPKASMVEASPGIEVYAIHLTAMLKPVDNAKPLIALLYVPIERLLEEIKVV